MIIHVDTNLEYSFELLINSTKTKLYSQKVKISG